MRCHQLLPLAFIMLAALPLHAQDATSSSTPPQTVPQHASKNPVKVANLPNAPSSLLTAHPKHFKDTPLQDIPHPAVKVQQLPLNIAGDELRIFLSPLNLRTGDLKWLLPVAGATAVTLNTDTDVSRNVVSHNVSFNATAGSVSDDIRDSFIAAPIAMYGYGLAAHNSHQTETGLLTGEAETDAYILDEVIKLGSFRERPNVDNARGSFYQLSAGYNSSFVSGHAIVSWSAAAVMAAEYPKPWQQVGVYTAATAVSVDRVLALEHFPTDVLLGSAIGWLVGHYVVRAHHHHFIYRHHDDQPVY